MSAHGDSPTGTDDEPPRVCVSVDTETVFLSLLVLMAYDWDAIEPFLSAGLAMRIH
jgi:hypothetical protein